MVPPDPQSPPASSALPTEPTFTTWTADSEPSTSHTNSTPASPTKPKPQRTTLSNAISTIKPGDFLSVHQQPCSRQGFLSGLGGGAAIGAIRFLLGAPVSKATNWAVGAGVGAAIFQYEFCQWQRRQERINMKKIVEVAEKKAVEDRKRAVEERLRRDEEAARRLMEEEQRWKSRSWYRFW